MFLGGDLTFHCPLFVELFAGTAALSLRLAKDGAKPPVSRMGAKTGYADRILTLLGLIPGQGADRYLWCEPDAGVRLLLAAYCDADLAKAAGAIIRSWADEDPRSLWGRLRAEGPARLPDGGATERAGEVARWAVIQSGSFGGDHGAGPLKFETWGHNPKTGERFPGNPLIATGPAICSVPTLPAAICDEARAVDPREVARWAFVQRVAGRGAAWGSTCDLNGNGGCDPRTGQRFPFSLTKNTIPIDETPILPAAICDDALRVGPGLALPPGTVVYMDPPYVGTTGYAADLPRADVVALARRWAVGGAVVCISEAEPIPELIADGWWQVEITDFRKGSKRTFSKQQREWLTMNRKPVEVVGPVFDLFG